MSYCREPIYMYSDSVVMKSFSEHGNLITKDWREMIAHVMWHMAEGRRVPGYAIEQLWLQLLASKTGMRCYGLEFKK